MNRTPFGWILLLMALSTLALASMQAYWLRAQYVQQLDALHRDARKSLAAVAADLNRRNSFVTQPGNSQTYDFQVWNPDSTQLFIFASNVSDLLPQPDTLLQGRRRAQADSLLQRLQRSAPPTGLFETIIFRSIQQCAHCEAVQGIAQRYPLDTLLAGALQQQGITLPFSWALRAADSSRWTFVPTTPGPAADTAALALSPLAMPLLGNEEVVYLRFPTQSSWVLTRLRAQLWASALLLAIIFGSFYYAWHIINRQKKLGDLKNDFINNMTHEFKTPIATIAFAAANIDNVQVLSDPLAVRQFTRIIRDENQRLNTQVEKVLQAAVADRHALDLKLEPTHLHQLLQPLADAAALRAQQAGGSFVWEDTGQLPTSFLTDAFHLANAVNNLLDNAIKYAGDRPPVVCLRTSATANGLTLDVADQGPGISRDQQTLVFDKFYRIPTGNLHNVKGFGLGLSYVKVVAAQLGGQVSVHSRPGHGSTFTLFLPYLSPSHP